VATAFVFNSHLNVNQLFDFILNDFEIPCEERSSSLRQIRLNEWLLERYREGQPAVLIVDEAQHLSFEVLEEIRMLTNWRQPRRNFCRSCFPVSRNSKKSSSCLNCGNCASGSPSAPRRRPLTVDETRGYIIERLRIAGGDGRQIFSPDAIVAIHKFAKGIPRVTNLLCEHTLINAYVDQQPEVQRLWSRKSQGNSSFRKWRRIRFRPRYRRARRRKIR